MPPTSASKRSATTRTGSSCPFRRADGAFRYYPMSLVERIRFIKRAQELGFSLEEVKRAAAARGWRRSRIDPTESPGTRLSQIEAKLADLERMQRVLKDC